MSNEVPNALEMEKKLIAALYLKDGKVIPEVASILKPSDFYREEHRCIYRAILKVYSRGTPPDVLLVEAELKRTNELTKVNRKYLFALTDYEFTTTRAVRYANIIREKAILRRLIEACEEIIDEAGSDQKSLEEILELAEKKIYQLNTQKSQNNLTKIDEFLSDTIETIIKRTSSPNEILGVSTKFWDIDKVLNGLQKSDLILLAARPSMGKTALALNIGTNAAQLGKVVVIFSLEMSKNQLGQRLLSTASRVNNHKLNTGNLTDEEMQSLINAVELLSNLDLYIDDTAGIGLLEMRTKIRRLKHEQGLDLVIIDYLQLMQGSHAENRQQEISEISRSLKALARELNVPILALSQLSRSVEMRAEKKPQLSDLRESGSLEQDADIVMFLYRDEYYNRDDENNENLAELIIAKNRNGPTTSLRLRFDKEIVKFDNLTQVAE